MELFCSMRQRPIKPHAVMTDTVSPVEHRFVLQASDILSRFVARVTLDLSVPIVISCSERSGHMDDSAIDLVIHAPKG